MIKFTIEISDEKVADVADTLNDCYGSKVTPEMVEKYVTRKDLLVEIFEGGWTDTCQREMVMDQITQGLLGTSWPTYGDSEKTKFEFDRMARAVGLT